MDLRDVLNETDPDEIRTNLQRYVEGTGQENPESAPERTIYLPFEPDTSTLFTRERLRLMEYLEQHGPLTIGELAQVAGRNVDAVSRDLKFLVNFGVLEVGRDPDDARRKIVQLAAAEIRLQTEWQHESRHDTSRQGVPRVPAAPALFQLAFAARLYSAFSDYDRSYEELRAKTGSWPDLSDPAQCAVTLNWLNAWGCRHLAKKYHEKAIRSLVSWFKRCQVELAEIRERATPPDKRQLEVIAAAFDDLSRQAASFRGNDRHLVTFGPTATAKVLFALLSTLLPPWDEPIRGELGFPATGDGYAGFVAHVHAVLHELEKECQRCGVAYRTLPSRLRRSGSTHVKLLDEFYWVTITRGCRPPSKEELRCWHQWSE